MPRADDAARLARGARRGNVAFASAAAPRPGPGHRSRRASVAATTPRRPRDDMGSKIQMSDVDTIKLIKEVKKRGCIWNHDDENYSERYHLSVAWDDVAKTLDMPEDIVRVKWKNLRDFFKKEVRKNRVEELDDYKGRWRHFKSLGFLLRPNEEQTGSEGDQDQEEVVYEPEYITDSNLEVYLDEEDPIPDKKFKASDEEEDYDLMFLKSLTPFLKQLEPTRNLVVRSRMQDMLLNEIAAQNMSNSRTLKKS